MKRALRRLDSVHEKLLRTVLPLEPTLYSQRPAEGGWSVAEIVHHLALVEEREGAIARPSQRIGFLRRLIPTSIVASRLIRVKAPKAVNPLDAPARDAGIENLNHARAALKKLCVTHGHQRLRQLIFKHPFLGNIDGVATVSFIGYHEQRHYKQIREVLKKLKN
jgi:DinB superfamily